MENQIIKQPTEIEIQNQISTMQFVSFNAREILIAANTGIKIRDLDDIEPIKQSLRYIFALIGLKAENLPSDLQKAVLIDFIKSEMKSFNTEEMKLAFRMAAAQKLNVDLTHYQNFNAVYFADVMNAFQKMKNSAQKEFNQQKNELDVPVEPTPETKKRLFWQFVDDCIVKKWIEYNEKHSINWGTISTRTVFETLENELGLIALTINEKREIYLRAEPIVKGELKSKSFNKLSQVQHARKIIETIENGERHIEFNDMVQSKAREIAIREYFEKLKNNNIDFIEIIETLKLKQ
jgi:hypothetical protein